MPPRRTREPENQSRAAGAPAPPSAAATAPVFYDAEPTVAASQLQVSDEPDIPVAEFREEFTQRTRDAAIPMEHFGSVDRDVAEAMAEEVSDDPAELAARIAEIRQFRKPLGAYSQKLALPQRRGYHTHWFNDTAGRVQEAEANGWAHRKGKDGKPICRAVGSGRDRNALYAYAMDIPEVFWLEDMAERHKAAADKMVGLKRNPFPVQAGSVTAQDRQKFYSPSEADVLEIEKR